MHDISTLLQATQTTVLMLYTLIAYTLMAEIVALGAYFFERKI